MEEQNPKPQLVLPVQDVHQVLKNPTIPKIYANGFMSGRSNSDLFLMPVLNGNPVLILNLSFQTAKQLRDLLNNTITELEKQFGHEIKTAQSKKDDKGKQ